MLVLSRKRGEKLRIGADISLVVLEVSGNRVRLGLSAPPDIRIDREELCERLGRPSLGEYGRTGDTYQLTVNLQ